MDNVSCPEILKKCLRQVSLKTEKQGYLKPETFTDEDIELLYKLGFSLYDAGDFLSSKEMFQRLVISRPLEVRFWKGLAGASQMNKDFEDALTAWSVLSLLEKNSFEASFHAAECYFSLNNAEEGKKALTEAKQLLTENSPFSEKIQALENAWENKGI